MKYLKAFLFLIIIVDFAIVHIALIILWARPAALSVSKNDSCPSTCTDYVNQQISLIPSPAAMVTPAPQVTIIHSPPSTKASKTVSYITIPGTGNTLNNSWTNLPGTEFYLNKEDYPNLTEARFESNFRLLNVNGYAYIRLFDVTVGIEVWGSEVKTNSQSFAVVTSDKLTLRDGNHLYRIQAKSLTADTTIYNSGRIKLITND